MKKIYFGGVALFLISGLVAVAGLNGVSFDKIAKDLRASVSCGSYPVYDCSSCNGLPSYPTFQYENCLTSCQNNFYQQQVNYNDCEDQAYQEQQNQQSQQAVEEEDQDQSNYNQQQTDEQKLLDQKKKSDDAAAAKKLKDAKSKKSTIIEITLKFGTDVKYGDTIKTSATEKKTIALEDGSTILLYPNSTFTLTEPGIYDTAKGIIDFVVKKLSGNNRFKVRSQTAAVAVRGTKFTVNTVNKSKTEVKVTEGVVSVSTLKGMKSVDVKAGYQVTVTTKAVSKATKTKK
ncbi:MAG: FecR family protein [Candidatus Gracilibacteria bacterium]|jgi:ferric-dicitrate binding protein FerR (iron transport regulator)